jgi:hypothetical protein
MGKSLSGRFPLLVVASAGNDLGKAVVGERGRGLLCIIWLTVSSLIGPKINARQQRHVGALGLTPWVRHR